jgi:hypothetical protein
MLKQTILLSIILLALFMPATKVSSNAVETWVVLVAGNDIYPPANFYSDTLYAYWVFTQKYHVSDTVEDEHIKYYYYGWPYWPTDEYSSKENVQAAMEWLASVSDYNDNVFIYFSCHGGGAYKNGTREGGIIDTEGDEHAEFQDCNGTWFGVDECIWLTNVESYTDDELRMDLSNITCGQMTVLLSACVSGNQTCFSGGFIDDLSAPNRVIITSSNETTESWGDLDDLLGVEDGFSEFDEGFFDALWGCDTYFIGGLIVNITDRPVNADYNADGSVSYQEAYRWAFEHDDARWAVRTNNGTVADPLDAIENLWGCEVDESPWMDDDGDGLPTFKAGHDIFLLGDFNFDGKVDVADVDLFITAYFSGEYDPLYDLDDNGTITVLDLWVLICQCCEKRVLSISASYGGTTNPSPGNHEYILGSSVNVTAIPNSWDDWKFDGWLLDGNLYYCNPITVTMDSDHNLKAYFIPSSGAAGGGQCPTLFVWNGTAYVDYGVMNIHNPTGEDVIREVPIQAEDVGISNHKALFRLREGWEGLNCSESVIDQVKLYALDNDGNRYLCSLTSAEHSSSGNVLPQLLRSDEWKVQTLLLETIDLTFVVLPHQSIQSFTFVIEGCNVIKE